MLTKIQKRHKPNGFTIAELMIATSVFSVILLVAATVVLNTGRTYYKGITITQTQEVAKQVLNDISSNIRLSSSVASGTNSGGGNYYCIGTHRYTYNLFTVFDTSSADPYGQSHLGLVEDQPPGGGCGNPFAAQQAVPLDPATRAELLGNQMQLLAFSITPTGTSTYSVQVTVASGSSELFSNPGTAGAQCKGNLGADQFCAVSSLSTIVSQGQTNI